mmetsp:Transcript_7162/g.10012  ORF Transcript_7162/g.10012 Transcript_7162/m.10012 type:complete len:121 (+) Transcript_7162:3-365(+)
MRLASPETHQSTLLEKEEEEDDDDNEDNQDGYPSARSSSSESVEGRGKATFEEKWQEREDELQREIREKKDEAQRQTLQDFRVQHAHRIRLLQVVIELLQNREETYPNQQLLFSKKLVAA